MRLTPSPQIVTMRLFHENNLKMHTNADNSKKINSKKGNLIAFVLKYIYSIMFFELISNYKTKAEQTQYYVLA